MSADEVLEVELKYDLNAGASVPDLTTLDVVHSVSGPVVEHLDATYYDTEALDLASNKITLRRRAGGHDEGWHLKRPAPANSNGRRELHAPLDSVTDASTETQTDHFAAVVPQALADQVGVHVRGRRLIPIATIATVRHITELRDEDDNVLAVLCDDNVTAQSLLPGGHAQSWNEWELELVNGNEKLLKKADKLLRANGARTASSASKLARTIGPTPTGKAHTIGKKPSALELVISELAEHRDHLIAQDPLVRENAPDAVHQMRVATRRARSVLQSFPHVLSADTAEHLGGELKHLAAVLGEARDAEVQLERNEHLLEGEKASESIVTALIDDQRETHRIALELAIDFLRSKRYFQLLEELDRTIAEPEAGQDAELIAADALDHAVKRSAKRASRRRSANSRNSPTAHRNGWSNSTPSANAQNNCGTAPNRASSCRAPNTARSRRPPRVNRVCWATSMMQKSVVSTSHRWHPHPASPRLMPLCTDVSTHVRSSRPRLRSRSTTRSARLGDRVADHHGTAVKTTVGS